jgi:hypothetical protein
MNPRARARFFFARSFLFTRADRVRDRKKCGSSFFLCGEENRRFSCSLVGKEIRKEKRERGKNSSKTLQNTQNKKSARIYITQNDKHPYNPRARNKRRKNNAPDRGQTRGRFTVVQRRARSVRGDDDFYRRDDDDDDEQETVWRFTLPRGKREGDGVHAKLSE